MDICKEALKAEVRIGEHIRETPLEYSPYLSRICSGNVYLKLENMQITGSFKFRGAINKLLSLDTDVLQKGVITASTGNHGAAFSYAVNKLGVKGTVYLPENASETKIERLRDYGADLKFYGKDCLQTEEYARKTAEEQGVEFVSPYNDPQIVGGQATIGIELERQLREINEVLIPVGGGGLAAGVAGYLKSVYSSIRITGCQPENSCVMYESVKEGRIVEGESLSSLADGTAGGIEKDSITFKICEQNIDEFTLVSEDEIKDAILLAIKKHNILIEGAGALSIATLIKNRQIYKNKNIVLVISGSKLSIEVLKEILK